MHEFSLRSAIALSLILLIPAARAACDDDPREKVSWIGCDKQNIVLHDVELRDAALDHANFTGADLTKSTISGVDAGSVIFQNANLTRVKALNGRFVAANFNKSILDRARFNNAMLDRSTFTEASAHNTLFDGAQLYNANLHKMDGKQASFVGANLEQAKLTKGKFAGANFSEANMNDADLEEANFEGAILHKAKLKHASLIDVSFRNADMEGADLSNADIIGADFTGAKLGNVSWPNRKRCRPGSVGECK